MNKLLNTSLGAAALLSASLLGAPTTALAGVSIYYSTGSTYNRHAYQRNPYRRHTRQYIYGRPYYGFGYYNRPYNAYVYPRNYRHYDRRHLHKHKHERRHENKSRHRHEHRNRYRQYRD